MDTHLTIEFVAERVGDFVGEVTVKSEVNVLTLTVSAKVVTASGEGPPQQHAPHRSTLDSADNSPRNTGTGGGSGGDHGVADSIRAVSTAGAGSSRPASMGTQRVALALDETKTLEELLASAQPPTSSAAADAGTGGGSSAVGNT